MLQVIANAEIQSDTRPELPGIFQIEAKIVVVEVVLPNVGDGIVHLSKAGTSASPSGRLQHRLPRRRQASGKMSHLRPSGHPAKAVVLL